MTTPVPPLAVQQDVARKAPQFASTVKLQTLAAEKAGTTSRSVLTRAFGGDLGVTLKREVAFA
jgi:hypothetical protein